MKAKPLVRWLLEEETPRDVIMVCGNGLVKIKAVLDEWHQTQPRSNL